MKMDYVRPQLLKDAEEIPGGVCQALANLRVYGKAFSLHLRTKGAKSSNRIDRGVVSLFPLQTAPLRHEHLCAAHLHAIDYVRNLHTVCLNLLPVHRLFYVGSW
jgi:hypothetical protein